MKNDRRVVEMNHC